MCSERTSSLCQALLHPSTGPILGRLIFISRHAQLQCAPQSGRRTERHRVVINMLMQLTAAQNVTMVTHRQARRVPPPAPRQGSSWSTAAAARVLVCLPSQVQRLQTSCRQTRARFQRVKRLHRYLLLTLRCRTDTTPRSRELVLQLPAAACCMGDTLLGGVPKFCARGGGGAGKKVSQYLSCPGLWPADFLPALRTDVLYM